VTDIPVRVSEKGWQMTVVSAAQLHGWRLFHPYDSRKSNPGWPDLVLWHPRRNRMMFRELKTDKGKLTKAQVDTLEELRACGADTGVWRPRDWEAVVSELAR
jgi:hypothetical protein